MSDVNVYTEIAELLDSDHHQMTLAACRCLSEEQRKLIEREAGLLIRYFCELPDCGWPMFGNLGTWEIENKFSYDIRRDLNASAYLDWNPVANTGERFGHDYAGSRQAIPHLLDKAVTAMQSGQLRNGLALAGAACHYLQDAVTFPEQQTLHRREMSDVQPIDISTYTPETLFASPQEVATALDKVYAERIRPRLKNYASKIRQAIFEGDSKLRSELHNQCDMLGAELTADILHSVLAFYKAPKAQSNFNVLEQFTDVDAEGMPEGYFIDRDDSEIFQGYAAVEGNYPRALNLRLTPGLQLRLSATGNSEVRWKQSIVKSLLVPVSEKYRLRAKAYTLDSTGSNGLRVLLYDQCWSVENVITIPLKNGSNWQTIDHTFELNNTINAMSIELFSRDNSGTILLDHWELSCAVAEETEAPQTADDSLRLALTPTADYYQKDASAFADQNEPMTSVRDNMPANISSGNEYVFDSQSFIEIPHHPLYAPLQVEENFKLSLELCPGAGDGEIMMSASFQRKPMSGWRLFLRGGNLCAAVYAGNHEHVFDPENQPVPLNQWQSVSFTLSPNNKITLELDGKVATAQAGFPRNYSKSGHFIGSCAGVNNFLIGRIKNLRINSIH